MSKQKPAPELPFVIEGNTASREMVRQLTKNSDGLKKIDLNLIRIRPGFNARRQPAGLDDELWEQVLMIPQLADGIYASNGPATPILGDLLPNGYFYQTDGERRIRALKRLIATGRDTYPNGMPVSEVRILLNPASTTDLERKLKVITTQENLPLRPMDRAYYYLQFSEVDGLTHDQIGAELNVSRQTVDNYILATSLPAETQEAINDGTISISNALKEHREKNKKSKDDGRPVDEKPAPIVKDLDGDEGDFDQKDNSITFPGSMGGFKEESGSVIAKDGIYQDKEKTALWKQMFNRIEVLKEKYLSSFVVNATFEEIDALDAHVIEIIKNEYLLTLK